MTGSARAQSSVHLSASKNRVALKTKAQSVAKLETTNYSTPPVFIPSLSVEDYSITSMDSRSVSDSVNLTSQPHLPTPTRRKSIGKHSASPSFKGSPDPILESSFESVHIDHELRRSSSVTSRTAHMSSSMMHQFKQNRSEVSLRNNDSIRPTSSRGQNKCMKDSSTVIRESLEAKINTTSSSRPTSPQQNLVGSLAFIERPSKIPTRSPSLSTLNIPLVSSTTFTGIPGLNTSISITKPPTTTNYQTPFLSSSKIPVSGAEKLRQQLAEPRIFPQQKPLLSAYSDTDFSTLLHASNKKTSRYTKSHIILRSRWMT
ncbi:hypothetical protein BCR33DRAFT_779763 [Rhizoclosmatium globosum]|uniref:Uncharacterized protein n=1 Tax=Rhizoclosmatium globosum TaxID=329046 RepID=A0A1Y2CZL7_9FUNG|nr:hypothetical protein BCR33DRAFT_779763 [Rhizoclosmatium globosum]|eukprot:ORY52469.1 hypothetical protein BCR33DRAFT_779763 [Rhizoclosmatium globosum]